MPPIPVRAFHRATNDTPIATWLAELKRRDLKAYGKCMQRIMLLAERGHTINHGGRQWSAYLRDDIFELRIRHGKINFRILYFFAPKFGFACLSHGITKESEVPVVEIERAIANKKLVMSDPEKYTVNFNF